MIENRHFIDDREEKLSSIQIDDDKANERDKNIEKFNENQIRVTHQPIA